ncbi:hypothetical protein BJ742DRAFT_798252 [Cladochytrium replicatum]|nr:hypothetical protein BJ742DRAFT_798252 [Cladochytrium replicatum]
MAARSSVHFTPFAGARDEDSPLCYLLEIDEAKILLDCGWTDKSNPDTIAALKRIAKQIDALSTSALLLMLVRILAFNVRFMPPFLSVTWGDYVLQTHGWLRQHLGRESRTYLP